MQARLKRLLQRGLGLLAIASGVAGTVIVIGATGILQPLEWAVLDSFFRLRPQEPVDPRIVIVMVGEADLKAIGQWPLPDQVLADLITQLNRYQPRAIGLALYRDIPIEPGNQVLEQVFVSTPNLVGIEKFGAGAIAPPATLAQRGQVGLADLVLDGDGRVRRGLLSVRNDQGRVQLGLATQLALLYLQPRGIVPQAIDAKAQEIQLQQAIFTPLRQQDGGYAFLDNGGYQILLNYRGTTHAFEAVSLTAVLKGTVSPDIFRDRIIIIGSNAASIDNFFYTPYDTDRITPGVVIHANLTSYIISAALGERQLLKPVSELLEWTWILLGSVLGVVICRQFLQPHRLKQTFSPYFIGVALVVSSIGIYTVGFFVFIHGWWLPITTASLSLFGATMISGLYYSQKLRELVSFDGLTQVANRRSFDHHLEQRLWEGRDLSLILCDVDYFKAYNDLYGHQAGDRCLQQIAEAIRSAVRRCDLVARYGGEEFAIILPSTTAQTAFSIAERIQFYIRQLHIPHAGSDVDSQITVSLGLANTPGDTRLLPADLIAAADHALYQAKTTGRNRIVVNSCTPQKARIPQPDALP